MPPSPRRRVPALAVLVTALAGAPAGFAAPPPDDVTLAPGGPSTAESRTLSWSAAAPDSGGTEVVYEGGVTTSAAPPGSPAPFGDDTSASLAAPEGRLWFHVRSVERGGLLVAPLASDYVSVGPVVSDRTRPVVTASASPAPNPRAWTRTPTTVSFECSDANPGPGGWCPAPVTVGEGAGQVVAGSATDLVGLVGSASLTLNVDLSDPAPAVPTSPADGSRTTSTRPEFAWTAASDAVSGVQYYEVIVVGRGKVGSSTARDTRLVSSRTLPAGAVQWYVRTVDNAGNDAVSATSTVTIDPTARSQSPDPPAAIGRQPSGSAAPAVTPPAPVVTRPSGRRKVARPASYNARALRPRKGVRLGYLRPVLRWKRGPRTTRLYNVQVFEIRGRRVRKVLTTFPRGTRYRVPPGKLRRDRRYVWRVWPYVTSRGYTRRPIGVSYFDIRPRPPAAARRR